HACRAAILPSAQYSDLTVNGGRAMDRGNRTARVAWVASLALLLLSLAACAGTGVSVPADVPAPAPEDDAHADEPPPVARADAPPPVARADGPPPVAREFRGVWIAAVSNLDWPSAPGLSPDSQRAELVAMVERARVLGLNAVVLHCRPTAAQQHTSELEPWSAYLTGEQGRAPDPW